MDLNVKTLKCPKNETDLLCFVYMEYSTFFRKKSYLWDTVKDNNSFYKYCYLNEEKNWICNKWFFKV